MTDTTVSNPPTSDERATITDSFQTLVDFINQATAGNLTTPAGGTVPNLQQLIINLINAAGLPVYDTKSDGLTATSNGQYFTVPPNSADGNTRLQFYKNVSGTAELQGDFPSGTEMDRVKSTLLAYAPPGWKLLFGTEDAAVAGIADDGTFTAGGALFFAAVIQTLTAQLLNIGAAGSMSPEAPTGYVWAVTNSLGEAVLGVKTDGTAVIGGAQFADMTAISATIQTLTAQLLNIGAAGSMSPEAPTGYVWAVTNSLGEAAMGVKADGAVVIGSLNVTSLNTGTSAAGAERLGIAAALPGLTHVMTYGQSLSVGVNASPVQTTSQRFGALKFNGGVRAQDGGGSVAANHASLVPLIETGGVNTGDGTAYETPVGGICDCIYERVIAENAGVVTSDLALLGSAPGQGSKTIAQLAKGSAYYQRLMDDVTYGYSLAQAAGKTYGLFSVSWIQGESDQTSGTTESAYLTALQQLQTDVDTDVSALLGASVQVPWFLYEFSSWINRTPNTTYPTIPLALLKAAKTLPRFYLACPMYQFDYADTAHLTGASSKVLGAYLGLAQKRALIDGETFAPLWDVSHLTQGKVVTLKLNPVGRLVADASWVSNPGNYGFSLVDSSGSTLTISSVTVLADSVQIVAAATIPTGAKLRYAFIGGTTGSLPGRTTGPRGCIRDSQGDAIVFDAAGLAWPMHNWLVCFERVIK